ncbi:hypothetical protein GF337_09305 [candidate division KSB1 bacterium]|nr:hypothetical protein [candidate division KSB1 bacterium]
MKFYKMLSIAFIFVGIIYIVACQKKPSNIEYKKWTVNDEPILTAGPRGMFDDVAVKDPSIIYYNDKYHLFYTSKTVKEFPYGIKYITGLGYVSAPTLEGLNDAKRYDINAMVEDVVISSQIFYFEPHKLWYLIAQTRVDNDSRLAPIYMTNPDIENGDGWTKPKLIREKRPNNGFWIDFWVICDETRAHMFYTDQQGALLKMDIPVDRFPMGFSDAEEKKVYSIDGKNDNGKWRFINAAHVYRVKKNGKYLAILEAAHPHPTNQFYWDARNRFLIAITADSLDGPWQRVEASENEFFANPANLTYKNGIQPKYTQISHFEVLRSGYNQKLEIDDYRFRILFEGMDGSKIPDSYNYNELPWELVLMKNY